MLKEAFFDTLKKSSLKNSVEIVSLSEYNKPFGKERI